MNYAKVSHPPDHQREHPHAPNPFRIRTYGKVGRGSVLRLSTVS
jgi:hypothetical protein